METITNVTNAVSKTIFGSGETATKQEEPQSGVQGDTSKGEPFDGGNMGDEQQKPISSGAADTEQKKPTPNDAADPGVLKDSSTGAGDHTKAQNDTRDPSDPHTEPEKAEAAKDVDDSGSGPNSTKVEGKGPAPIADIAKAHDGDAGQVGKDGKDGKDGEVATEDKSKGDDGDDDGPQKENHDEGTGEKYVKSSGLKADGGDFDASNPGAGREADRLLEAKGIHHDVGPPKLPEEESESSSATPDKKKRSLGEKIKEKLHRSSKS